jgi:hypothetical protein
MYVLPLEKHELDLVTSTCIISCNVLLQYCTRHTRTLSLLMDLKDSREANLRGLGSYIEAINGSRECAMDERS